MGSKGSQKTESTSTQTSRADPRAEALYTDVMARAQAAAAQPYQAYQGQMVAGFTPDQLAAMQGVRDVQGAYAPYLQTAAEYGTRAGQAISPTQIQAAMSPYIQGVIQPTLDVMTAEGQKAASRLRGTEAQQHAFGGTRGAVVEANLAAEQERNKNLIVSDLMQKGYSQAVAQAQADRSAAGQGAGIMGNIAGAYQQMPLAGYNALLQSGALQQQLAQQQLNVPYQQFLQAQAYPYQQAQWLASIGQGLGPLLGGTSSGQSTTIATPAQPSVGSQIFGGLMSLAALPMTGGASLGGMGLSALGSRMFSADGGRVPHKADGGAVDGDNVDVVGAMAQALQLADAEVSQPQPAQQPAQMADGGAVPNAGDEIVQGALRLAQTMKRGLGGAADHMADGGVPGSTLGTIDVGGRKIVNIFPSSRLSGSSFRAPEVKYAPAGEIKTPDYSSITKGLGAAFKQPEPFTTFGSSQGQIGASQIGSKGLPSFKVGSDGQLPTLSGWSPVSSSSAPTPIDYSMYSMPEYGAPYAHGGIVPHHAKDGGLMFDPTPISEQVPDDVLPTVDRETAFTPEPITGEKIPQIAEVSMPRPRPQIGEEPTGELAREARALSNIESGGRYDIVGPVANKAGNRAYGKYQVMDFNVGPWTSRYYGTELTPQEFLRNPEAQEAVFKGEFGRLAGKYGSEGAAKAWFAGERGMNEPGRRDVLGTTVADYARKFSAGLGEPRTAERAQEAFSQLNLGGAGLPENAMPYDSTTPSSGPVPAEYAGMSRFPEQPPAEAAPAPVAPPTQRQVATANRATSIFENLTGIQLSDEGRMAMMAMGLKMMTTPGSIGTAIGAGGLQGLATYSEAQQLQRARAEKEREYQLRKLQAEREERRLTETERHQREMERLRTVPSGYRLTPTGALEKIPGGPKAEPEYKDIEIPGIGKMTIKIIDDKPYTIDGNPLDLQKIQMMGGSLAETQEKKAQAASSGVPMPVTDYVSTLPLKDQSKVRTKIYQDQTKILDKEEPTIAASQGDVQRADRFLELNTFLSGPILGNVKALTAEAAEMDSISADLSRKMRQPGEGATSDFDAKQFLSATVSRAKPKEANENIAAAFKAAKQNQMDFHNFKRQYLEQNQTLEGARDYWRAYLEANPILDKRFEVGKDGDTSKLRLNPNRKNYNEWFRERMAAKDPIVGPNATWKKEQAVTPAAATKASGPQPGAIPGKTKDGKKVWKNPDGTIIPRE